jgi:hypothetical protein
VVFWCAGAVADAELRGVRSAPELARTIAITMATTAPTAAKILKIVWKSITSPSARSAFMISKVISSSLRYCAEIVVFYGNINRSIHHNLLLPNYVKSAEKPMILAAWQGFCAHSLSSARNSSSV